MQLIACQKVVRMKVAEISQTLSDARREDEEHRCVCGRCRHTHTHIYIHTYTYIHTYAGKKVFGRAQT